MPFLLELTRGDGSRIYLDSEKVYALERASTEPGSFILALIEVTTSNENSQPLGFPSHQLLAVEKTPFGNSRLILAVIDVAESYDDLMQRIELYLSPTKASRKPV